MADPVESQSFEGWCILELMGHRRLGGYCRSEIVFGTPLCRIDIPAANDFPAATQFYSPSAIYCVTPCDEATARATSAGFRPTPVHRWELPKLEATSSRLQDSYGDVEDEDR